MFKEFREFIKRGNVVDLAVAVILATAFGRIITTLVESVIMPPIGLLLGKVDFSGLFINLSHESVDSLADAKARGLPVIAYGQFINDVISFLIVAFVIFLIVKRANRLWSDEPPETEEPTTKNCPFCVSTIAVKATRCPQCTSELQTA